MDKTALVIIGMQTGCGHPIPDLVQETIIREAKNYEHVYCVRYIERPPEIVKEWVNSKVLPDSEVEIIEPLRGYPCFDKKTLSAATDELVCVLFADGITTVRLCGMYVESCILATAFALRDLGFNIEVVEDGVWTTWQRFTGLVGLAGWISETCLQDKKLDTSWD